MPAKKTKECDATEIDLRYVPVVEAFAERRGVSRENRKGFGSGALKVKGKIFAMMSSKRQFVVKLPKNRVDELVNLGKGQRFDPGHGIRPQWRTFVDYACEWEPIPDDGLELYAEGKPR